MRAALTKALLRRELQNVGERVSQVETTLEGPEPDKESVKVQLAALRSDLQELKKQVDDLEKGKTNAATSANGKGPVTVAVVVDRADPLDAPTHGGSHKRAERAAPEDRAALDPDRGRRP